MTSTIPNPPNPDDIARQFRQDSRLMMQAMAQNNDAVEFRNPNPMVGGVLPLTQQEIETCLADAILKRIAWTLPLAATQKLWGISLGDDYNHQKSTKIVKEYYKYHKKIKTREKFRRAMCLARSHGGSVIIMLIDDGRHYSMSVNEKAIKSINGLIVRHRWQIEPCLRTSSNIFDLEDIQHYEILTKDTEIKNSLMMNNNFDIIDDNLIHQSRILRFDGFLMPDDWMIKHNNGWGLSVFNQVWKYYKYYSDDLKAIKELIKTHSVLQHSFEGLRELMNNSSEESVAAIKETMKSIRMMYDLYGMVLHDSRESFNWNARPVSGIENLVDVHKVAVTAAAEMPHTLIWGESPGGLGRDGKETQINHSNKVSEYQAEVQDTKLEVLDNLIFLSKDSPTKGKQVDDFKRDYPSILKQSIDDIRGGRNSDAQALATSIQAGYITVDEARTVPANPDWWPELNLDEEGWQRKKEEESKKSDYISSLGLEENNNETTGKRPENNEETTKENEKFNQDSVINERQRLIESILSVV